MLFKEVIILIKFTKVKDADGFDVETETGRRTVYADKKSVRQTEFYQAQAQNIKLDQVFVIRSIDYDGETTLEHSGNRYKVIRTYEAEDEMLELVCSRLESR